MGAQEGMQKVDWSIVKKAHILKACQMYDRGEARPLRQAKNTFLIVNGREYPAKFIRGLAYFLAAGHSLNPSADYSGGLETARFFRGMGFDTEYDGKRNPENIPQNGASDNASTGRMAKRANDVESPSAFHGPAPDTSQSVRIATVCASGEPSRSSIDSVRQQRLLDRAIHSIESSGWRDIDAILLPGGFFYHNEVVECTSFEDRVRTFSETTYSSACMEACMRIAGSSPGVMIVAGVDARPDSGQQAIVDQFCVAWSQRGVIGIGRKVFPTNDESKGKDGYVCISEDYASEKRTVRLNHGATAILCACYDVFGCAENNSGPTARSGCIRRIRNHDGVECTDLKEACISRFQNLIREHKVSVALGAIHYNPSRYWQIHGIQACSAALGGGLVVGASHFENLPAPSKMTLSAFGIPAGYLTHKPKNKRPLRYHNPTASRAGDGLLVRLFDVTRR